MMRVALLMPMPDTDIGPKEGLVKLCTKKKKLWNV